MTIWKLKIKRKTRSREDKLKTLKKKEKYIIGVKINGYNFVHNN